MKKASFFCAAVLLFAIGGAHCAEFRESGGIFAVDFQSSWKEAPSKDPSVTLRAENGRSFFEFAKLDSELSDYYLKARVKEQVDSLRSKGISLGGDVRPVPLRGGTAYYVSYESMGVQAYMAFFTYGGASYAISASGVPDADFRWVLATIRKPGEKLELPKPKKQRLAREKERDDDDDAAVAVDSASFSLADVAVSTEPEVPQSSVPVMQQTAPAAEQGAAVTDRLEGYLSKRMAEADARGLRPYIERRPLPVWIWLALVLLWAAGSRYARGVAAKFIQPRIPPPPKEVPPDFFFPFLVTRAMTLRDGAYNIVTRQKQLLLGVFSYEHEIFLLAAFYGIFAVNLLWSLLAFTGRAAMMINALLYLPGGRLLASIPELFLLIPLVVGLIIKHNKRLALKIYDAQSNLVVEVNGEAAYGLMLDGKGKEVARLTQKSGGEARTWDYTDVDNLYIFTVKDDSPAINRLRRFFGHMGGPLRCRYGIFVQERRAGFVFVDPSHVDMFQIHMDFSFARLAPPANILAAVLYIMSREKDTAYPSPF